MSSFEPLDILKTMGLWSLVVATFSDWYEDRAQRLGAALAYYTVFALAPGVVLVVAVAGLGLGPDRALEQILEQLGFLLGEEGARAIGAVIANARQQSAGQTAAMLATATLVFGLWGVFGELQDAFNTIWGVVPRSGRGMLQIVRDRFLSFAMVTGIGFLLLVSLAVSAWLAALGKFFSERLPAPELALKVIDVGISFAVITLLFALMVKLLPDVRIAWRDVWLGAAVTSVLFTAGKSLIGLYLGKSSVASVYGAAGLPRGDPGVGLLLLPDRDPGRGVHQGVDSTARLGLRSRREGRAADPRGEGRAGNGQA